MIKLPILPLIKFSLGWQHADGLNPIEESYQGAHSIRPCRKWILWLQLAAVVNAVLPTRIGSEPHERKYNPSSGKRH
jgi:hypothetical protein